MTQVSVVPYGGWNQCLRLSNEAVELVATLEVGPRVIRFGFIGGPNEFVEYPDQMGTNGGAEYRSYGGHRLWAAPERLGWTNHPDNNPVEWKQEETEVVLQAPVESGSGLQKEIRMLLDPQRAHVRVTHKIINRNSNIVTLAPWALSVMAPGGRAIIPHEPFQPHSERVLPVRPLVLWSYTDMADPRWTWGKKFIQLQQDVNRSSPQKCGAMITKGWAAYANHDNLFLKRFRFDPRGAYPDFGCNAELFTNGKMLEVESLGSLKLLKTGESATLEEEWLLFRNVNTGNTDDEIETSLIPLLEG